MRLRKGPFRAALFAGVFVLCGLLRVLTYQRDLLDGFSQLLAGALLLIWTIEVQTRVTDRRLQRLILCTAASLLLFLTVQLFRGCMHFDSPVLARYYWYCYYIPFIATPLMLFLCSLAVWRPRTQPLPRWAWAVAAAAALLALCALTNDLHQLMFRFPDGVFRNTDLYTPGPLFWLYFLCYGALLLSAFLISVVKAWQIRRGVNFLVPAIPPLLLGAWMILNLYHVVPAIAGVKLWLESDCFTFAMMAYLEACIRIGLIPANTGYGPLFSRLDLSAAVLDRNEAPVYRSAGIPWPFPEGEALLVRRQEIGGGSVTWAVDLSPVLTLNRQLEEITRQLDQRNDYLRAESRMKKELTELETRNRLYEQVSGAVRPQLEEIEALSRQAPQDFMKTLPRLCLLTAYVKRRCNMELLSEDGSLPLEELEAALTESLEYLKLNGVENALSFTGSGRLPAGLVISAYEHLHVLASDALDAMQSLVLRVCGAAASEGEAAFLELRLLLRTRHPGWDFAWPAPGISAPQPRVQFSVEGRDLCLVLRFEEGGGKA